MPFPMRASAATGLRGRHGGRKILAGGELALPLGVASVSRLIGKLDSIAWLCGWQVPEVSPAGGNTKRRSLKSGVRCFLRWHWPSSLVWAGGLFRRA